jgi:hypothetical protein
MPLIETLDVNAPGTQITRSQLATIQACMPKDSVCGFVNLFVGESGLAVFTNKVDHSEIAVCPEGRVVYASSNADLPAEVKI